MRFLKISKFGTYVQITGLCFFSFLFVLAWIYYQERIFCVDPSFFLFKLIHFEDFIIEFGRWGAIPSQILPLGAIKNNFSLETVMRIYSVSFVLIFYFLFLICTLILKNSKAGIAIMLGLCLVFRHAFYYSTTELYQGMAIALLIWALISPEEPYKSKTNNWIAVFFSAILIYLVSYFHQISLFVVLFILIMEFLKKPDLRNFPLLSLLLFSLLWFFVRVFFLSNTNYEKEKIIDLKILFEQFPALLKLPGTIYFQQFFLDNYFAFSLPVLITIILLFTNKNWILLVFYLLFSTGYLIIVSVTFYRGESPLVLENYFSVLGFFMAPLLVLLLYEKFEKRWALLIIIPLLLVNMKGIYGSHYVFSKKKDYLNRVIEYSSSFQNRKFMIHHHNFPWNYAWVKWTFPFETAILSSLPSPDSTSTFFISDDMNKYNLLINEENIFLGTEWNPKQFSCESINKNYFRLPSTGYLKLCSSQNDSAFNEKDFNTSNFSMSPVKPIYESDADSFIVAELFLHNHSGKKLHSIPKDSNPIYLSYHLYDEEGNLVLWDGSRSTLEVDILTNYRQGLYLIIPKNKGKYIVEADFVTEGIRWWGINTRFSLIVD